LELNQTRFYGRILTFFPQGGINMETQYQRDISRLEAHRLALKDDEFQRLVETIRRAVTLRYEYLRDQGVSLRLHDHSAATISVANDGLRIATFAFDYLRHEATARGLRFRVLITRGGNAVVTVHESGQPLGTVNPYQITKLVHNAVDIAKEDR
jgi:hypothetical protein